MVQRVVGSGHNGVKGKKDFNNGKDFFQLGVRNSIYTHAVTCWACGKHRRDRIQGFFFPLIIQCRIWNYKII